MMHIALWLALAVSAAAKTQTIVTPKGALIRTEKGSKADKARRANAASTPSKWIDQLLSLNAKKQEEGTILKEVDGAGHIKESKMDEHNIEACTKKFMEVIERIDQEKVVVDTNFQKCMAQHTAKDKASFFSKGLAKAGSTVTEEQQQMMQLCRNQHNAELDTIKQEKQSAITDHEACLEKVKVNRTQEANHSSEPAQSAEASPSKPDTLGKPLPKDALDNPLPEDPEGTKNDGEEDEEPVAGEDGGEAAAGEEGEEPVAGEKDEEPVSDSVLDPFPENPSKEKNPRKVSDKDGGHHGGHHRHKGNKRNKHNHHHSSHSGHHKHHHHGDSHRSGHRDGHGRHGHNHKQRFEATPDPTPKREQTPQPTTEITLEPTNGPEEGAEETPAPTPEQMESTPDPTPEPTMAPNTAEPTAEPTPKPSPVESSSSELALHEASVEAPNESKRTTKAALPKPKNQAPFIKPKPLAAASLLEDVADDQPPSEQETEKSEAYAHAKHIFTGFDSNKDGFLDSSELADLLQDNSSEWRAYDTEGHEAGHPDGKLSLLEFLQTLETDEDPASEGAAESDSDEDLRAIVSLLEKHKIGETEQDWDGSGESDASDNRKGDENGDNEQNEEKGEETEGDDEQTDPIDAEKDDDDDKDTETEGEDTDADDGDEKTSA